MNNLCDIWTIGHSTRTIEEFIAILKSFNIELVADIRSYPGSRKFPHFNSENLMKILPENGIEYVLIPQLGGRRKMKPDSDNIQWKHPAFRGYADYMETSQFQEGINILTTYAKEKRTAYMCSEAVWWRCHRSLVSDYLKSLGWKVIHIMDEKNTKEHPYTAAARLENGKLTYKSLL